MRPPFLRGPRSGPDPADLPRSLPGRPEGWTTGDDALRPAEWSVPRGVRTASEWAWRSVVIAAALVGFLYLSSLLSEVVIPVLVALLLSALLHPVYDRLARILPRGLAAGLTVIGTIAVVSGLLSFVGSQLTSQLGDITSRVTDGIEQIRQWAQDSFGITDTQLTDYIARARDAFSSGNLTDSLAAAGLTVGHLVAGFFLALFTLFFFLYDGAAIWAWVVRVFPRGARTKVHSSGLIAWGQLAAFTRATIFVALADATGIGIGAAILGVPFASGIALLVFFGAFIPIVGAAVSGGVAVLLALVALGPVQALIMLGIVIGVQQLESHLLQPLLIGRAMRLHPLAVILAIAAGLILAGIIGGLIAVPTVAVLNAVGHHLLDSPDGPGAHETEDPTVRDVLGPAAVEKAEASAAEDSPDAPIANDATTTDQDRD
ncbi:AI-2E family transporter [Phycicoccus sp. CSK15P-2]|uniref:AI-2E family transporter n=1 Tax=Phycicoccus sp. CSK15P-2 TaxID=2807627 RepID=UPI0019522A48|nr:AI-2E family transporter [Phycicoccus sp. CSK15P-2]MBM6402644.1 AI-2E family transporter [Phycicoccus sp. CSK15P-2]